MTLFDPFLLRALIGGVGVALATGPLGVIVVWRRMAYFGDALAHSSLLGVAIALWLDTHILAGVIATSVVFSLLLSWMQRERAFSSDTLLGILAHGSLATGIVATSLIGKQVDLESYLFGDVLAITTQDIAIIYTGTATVLLTLFVQWENILMVTLHPDLAASEGINTGRTRMILMLLVALLVAMAIKVVGILLITSLLIIPAAAARRVSATPERMACLAMVVGVVSVIGGLMLSLYADTPAGPSVVVTAVTAFIIFSVLGKK